MASGSANRAYSSTLVASTVDTVTLHGYSRHVLVENTGTGVIFVVATGSNSGASVTPADPTVNGADEISVAAGASVALPVAGQWPSADSATWPLNQVIAKLISSGTPTYTVSLV